MVPLLGDLNIELRHVYAKTISSLHFASCLLFIGSLVRPRNGPPPCRAPATYGRPKSEARERSEGES